jgi:hypothetical protein
MSRIDVKYTIVEIWRKLEHGARRTVKEDLSRQIRPKEL